MLRPLRYRRLWLALGIVMLGVMFVVCLAPRVPGPSFPGVDKIEHLLAWLVLTAWFAALVERRAYLPLAAAMIATGIGIEFAQEWMDLGRHGDWRDVVANSLGVVGGVLLPAATGESWLVRIEKWLPST